MRRLILLYFLFCVAVFSAEVVQYLPLNPKEPVASGGYCVINFELINTDPGAIYNSGFISGDIFGGLASELLSLPSNSSNYDTIEELMLDWSLNIRSPPTGQVYNGWQNRINPDGSIDLWNNGLLPGITYDQWTSTPGSSTMALTLRIPLFQLEFDGNAGYSPEFDVSIVLSGTVFSGAFVGFHSQWDSYSSPMYAYILSYPYLSCSYIDISGDGFIDLYDFVYIFDNWLTDYSLLELYQFFDYWLTACE